MFRIGRTCRSTSRKSRIFRPGILRTCLERSLADYRFDNSVHSKAPLVMVRVVVFFEVFVLGIVVRRGPVPLLMNLIIG